MYQTINDMNLLKPLAAAGIIALCGCAQQTVDKSEAYAPVDYVNTLMGTDSKFLLSNGNTYPAVAVPWGMNFWTPQTGRMGDGWTYAYAADKLRGFKQTHQPSPWINDYGQFAIMPVTGGLKIGEDERASWFSHKAETATPYYDQVYLADHDVVAEMSPSDRGRMSRCCPTSGWSGAIRQKTAVVCPTISATISWWSLTNRLPQAVCGLTARWSKGAMS